MKAGHRGPTHGQETRVCAVCGRTFANRKSWSSRGQWESVRYCSERCRRAKGKGMPKSAGDSA
ncbi:MAG: DUF2256 domain-containing protein [Capsulimonadales bacterium]|nr:DUF2256 domain-containing protein [Capsulimonadales bacterium]